MGSRKVEFAPGEFYHVFNRGNSKQKIFLDAGSYAHFQKLLYLCNSSKPFIFRDIKDHYAFARADQLVAIGAYCLMPNHFHILLKEVVPGGIHAFMHRLSTSYSMYHNTKHRRVGKLFEGAFRSEHAPDDTYLKYLFSYIHLNPVKRIEPEWKEKGIVDARAAFAYLGAYAYSSLPEYLNNDRQEACILNKEEFPEYFSSTADMEGELLEWITYTEASPL